MKITPTSKLAILTSLAVVPFVTISLMLLPADLVAGLVTMTALLGIGILEFKSSSTTNSYQRHPMHHECCNG